MAKKVIKVDLCKVSNVAVIDKETGLQSVNANGDLKFRKVYDINNAIKALRSFKYKQLIRGSAMASTIAQQIKDEGLAGLKQAPYDGHKDVRAHIEVASERGYGVNANGGLTSSETFTARWRVVFTGKSLYFIEFGTGKYYNPTNFNNEWRKKLHVANIGTYGKGRGSRMGWGYYYVGNNRGSARVIRRTADGQIVLFTRGNPPARAIFNAVQKWKKADMKELYRKARAYK